MNPTELGRYVVEDDFCVSPRRRAGSASVDQQLVQPWSPSLFVKNVLAFSEGSSSEALAWWGRGTLGSWSFWADTFSSYLDGVCAKGVSG